MNDDGPIGAALALALLVGLVATVHLFVRLLVWAICFACVLAQG